MAPRTFAQARLPRRPAPKHRMPARDRAGQWTVARTYRRIGRAPGPAVGDAAQRGGTPWVSSTHRLRRSRCGASVVADSIESVPAGTGQVEQVLRGFEWRT